MIKKSHLGVYGMIIHHRQLLLIKKSRGPYKGKYDLPGGSIEFGESMEEALMREIKEETNFGVKSYTFHATQSATIEYRNSRGEDIQFHHLGIIYDVVVEDVKIPIKIDADDHDSLGAVWISIEDYDLDDFSPFAMNILKKYSATFE